MTEVVDAPPPVAVTARHARWVRICHWTATAGILTLAVTGVVSDALELAHGLGVAGGDGVERSVAL